VKLKRFGTAVAALTLAVTAGCGAGAGGGEATEAPGGGLTEANFASTVAQAQEKATTTHVEADIKAQGQQFTMAGDVDGREGQVAADFTMSGAALGGNARFILVDKVMYIQIPGLTPRDKFVKFDLQQSNAPGAAMLGQMLDQINQLDPSKSADMFKAVTAVKELGTEEVDGVETTHYAVTVDTQKAMAAMGMADMAPSGQMPKTITQDVWLDGDNLIRRMRMKQPNVTMDLTYSQWGEDVEISAPPASQTTDMEQMMSQMGGAPATGTG
jgi:lipoprotein LprG